MEQKSKIESFLEGQLDADTADKVMAGLRRYEFKQALRVELARQKAQEATQWSDETEFESVGESAIGQTTTLSPVETPILPLLPKQKIWELTPVRWGIAASLLLMLSTLWFYTRPPANASFQQFVLMYPLPQLLQTAAPIPSDNARHSAKEAYLEGNYQKAAGLYQQLVENPLKEREKEQEDLFYGAMSCWGLAKQTDNSAAVVRTINYLERLRTIHNGWKADEIDFYQALAYYQNHQLEKAKTLFEKIAARPGKYQQEVQKNIKNFPTMNY